MCGLVGMMGRPFDSDRKAFRSMLMFDYERGKDSTGVAVIHDKNEMVLLKELGHPVHLFDANPDHFTDTGVYKKANARMFIGHNRAATKGKVTKENAHPFHFNTVVGAHNGTLVSTYPLENGHIHDVDSMAIFDNLDKYEARSVIGDVHGAYALVWYDFNESKAYIIRNDKRPLFWCRREDGDVIFWASEEWMLWVALSKNNIKHTEPKMFEENTLYSFDLSKADSFQEMKKLQWETVPNVMGYTPPVVKPKKTQPTTTFNRGTTNSSATTHTQTSGGGTKPTSNVLPFTRNHNATLDPSNPHDKKRLQEMKEVEGTVLTFRFGDLKKGISGAEYLSAYLDNPLLDYDIRVFAGGHSRFKSWKDMKHRFTFKGKVKRMVKNTHRGKVEAYLLIDLRTIEQIKEDPKPVEKLPSVQEAINNVIEADDKSNLLYEGFNGAYLNEEEWNRATDCGCAGCTTPADPLDAGMKWIDPENFLCGRCASMEFYQDFLPNFGS